MVSYRVFTAEHNKMVCRGGQKNCIGVPHSVHTYRKVIQKDTLVLQVSDYYYCEVCMIAEMEKMEEIGKQIKDKLGL